MSGRIKILQVEDNLADAELVLRALRKSGFEFDATRVQTEEEFVAEISRGYDLILADFELPQFSGLRALSLVKARKLEIPFILVSGTVGEDIAVEAIQLGASDYLLKDRLVRLGPAVRNALGRSQLLRERADALRALLANEERYRIIIENSSDIVALVHHDGVMRYVSPSVERMLGFQPAELEGDSIFRLIHPDDVSHVQRTIAAAADLELPTSVEVEYRMRNRQGDWRSLHSIGRRVTLFDFGPIIVVNSRDVTERNRVEQSLRESEERFRELAENMSEAFWISTPDKQSFLYVSPAYEKIWGRSTESLLQAPASWLEAVHEQDRDRVRRAVHDKQVLGLYNEVFRIVRPDGTVRWIHDQAFPIREPSGRVVRLIGTAEDITKMRSLEAQLRQAQKLEAIGTLAGGIAHDFNNILAAITGYTSLAKSVAPLRGELRDHLAEVEKASSRAADLVKQILAFGRRQEQQRALIQLKHVVTESLKLLRATIPTTIEFRQNLEGNLPTVLADATQIHQVIMNLGTNAWHAMGDRPGVFEVRLERVRVDARLADSVTELREGDYVCIQVSDTGCGMDERTRERIFEPFFTTKESGSGTGLGLAVVHGIVQAHDGAITVHSEVGRGTVFHLYFPATLGTESKSPVVDPNIARGGGEHVLLVDDEEILARLLKRLLEKIGYEAHTCTNPVEALELIRQNPGRFQLLITDQTMPGLTGLELCAQVKTIVPSLPVVLMTGYNAQVTPERVGASGVSEVLYKPVPLDQIASTLKRLVPHRPT